MADTQQQIVEALKERFPAPWFERHAVDDDGWFSKGAFVWVSRLDNEYFKISRDYLDELLAAVLAIPLPAPMIELLPTIECPVFQLEPDETETTVPAPPVQRAGEDTEVKSPLLECVGTMTLIADAMRKDANWIECVPLLESVSERISRVSLAQQARLDAADKLADHAEWALDMLGEWDTWITAHVGAYGTVALSPSHILRKKSAADALADYRAGAVI